jgi:TolA-binding protein
MDCPLRSGHDLAEPYVAGTLAEPDQSAFEEHFFSCQACLAHVQMLQEVRDRLAAVPARPKAPDPRWAAAPWLGLALAAGLVAAIAFWWNDGSVPRQAQAPTAAPVEAPGPVTPPVTAPAPAPAPPAPTPAPTRRDVLGQLAMMVPPRYVPISVRGAAPAGSFDAAMAHYVAGRYGEAAAGLRALAAAGPSDPGVQFFLGVSDLASGRIAEGRAALTRVVDADAQPYTDEAHFYLGKAALAAGDIPAARRELRVAVSKEAGPDGEAARILAELERLPPR